MSLSLSLPTSLSSSPSPGPVSDSASNVSPSSQPQQSASSAPPPSAPVSSDPVPSSAPPSSSAPASASASPDQSSSSVLTAPSTTVSESTMIATSNGVTITSIVQITSTIAPGTTVVASTSGDGHKSSNAGAIAGGVIGGLAVLGIVAGVLLWYRRRQKAHTDFDGDFDPARVGGARNSLGPEMMQAGGGGTLPDLNLDDEDDGMGGRLPIGGAIITPFAYTPTVSAFDASASSRSQSPPMPSGSPPSMSQYSQDSRAYTPTMSSVGGYYAAVPQQAQPMGGYYPTAPSSTSGSSAYGPRSAKEREAMAGSAPTSPTSRSFAITNPGPSNELDENQYQQYLRSGPRRASQGDHPPMQMPMPHSPMASSSGASGVIVHQDGGRVQGDIEADEIPPTYDSIPNDEQRK